MKSKKGIELSFAWIFAIIVGAFVIFLAIYATTKFIKTDRVKQDTELAKELGVILTPIETNLETAKTAKLSLPLQTRITNTCTLKGTFGEQKISTATKSSIGKPWQESGESSAFRYKYIFSAQELEGKKLIIFSKPFEMPFKIANLVYIWPEGEEYCFINSPKEIEEEITELKFENIKFSSSLSQCSSKSKKVCFSTTGCDIDISLDTSNKIRGSLKRKFEDRVYFETPSLLYAAIFTDPKIYECQIKRLMKRAAELSSLYNQKTIFLTPKGCASNLESDLSAFIEKTSTIQNSLDLIEISFDAESLRRKNNDLSCKLF